MPPCPVLSMTGVTKEYFGNTVLKDVSIEVQPGEIHALIGENGAGKSTLMNVLFGMPVIHQTGGYRGEVSLDGVRVDIKSPWQAMSLGIGMVHQEFMLIPGFTVTENIKLNREITRPNLVSRILGRRVETLDHPAMRADARKALDKLSMSIEELAVLGGLPVGHMQMVEIAREIDKHNVRLLVFDEPTAVLTESEASEMLEALKRVAAGGVGILLITHRLSEVVEIADRITVLRDGEKVAELPGGQARIERLAELMVGRSVQLRDLPPHKRPPTDDDLILKLERLSVDMPGEKVRGVNLNVRRGEILGIAGLGGHGKVGISNGIVGLFPVTGEIIKDGVPIPNGSPRETLARGVAFLSENRRDVGLLLEESIELNIVLTAMQVNHRFLRRNRLFPWLSLRNDREIGKHANKMIADLDIRCRSPEQPVRRLSGGNQQKVCIARALTLAPDLLLVSEPTRGIDVGAKNLVMDLLVQLNRELDMTIVMTSSELAELRSICDRIAVVYHGSVAGILRPDASDVEFGLLMAGGIQPDREVS